MTELRCKSCTRFIGEFECIVGEVICPNTSCKAGNQVKMINNDLTHLVTFKFLKPARPPKGKTVDES